MDAAGKERSPQMAVRSLDPPLGLRITVTARDDPDARQPGERREVLGQLGAVRPATNRRRSRCPNQGLGDRPARALGTAPSPAHSRRWPAVNSAADPMGSILAMIQRE
jgi:hypothetical protein